MTKQRIVVIGTAVIDVIGYAERRPREGETLVGTGYEVAPGGKGLNQAVAAARAGAHSSLIAAIGNDDFGVTLQETLSENGVDTDAVLVRDEESTGVGLPIVTRTGANSIVVVPGASAAIGDDHHDWMNTRIDGDTVFLSQAELPSTVVKAAMVHASGLGARVVLNPAPAGDIGDMIEHVNLLVPNEHEAEDLTGISDPEAAGRELQRQKEGLEVVVTCGSRGALVLGKDGSARRVEAPRVTAIDTVGAGDVFCGYLVAMMATGNTLLESAEVAVRAASISVTRRGAAGSAPRLAELQAQPGTRG